MSKLPLTVCILTLNSAHDLPRCLARLSFAQEIMILDAGSTDTTLELAKKEGLTIVEAGPTVDFARTHNLGLSKARHDWVLFVDTDEVVSPELAQSIEQAFDKPSSFVAYQIDRRDYFLGRLLRYGNTADSFIRLAQKKVGKWARPVHEVWEIEGSVGHLDGSLYHYSHRSVRHFVEKANWYTDTDAQAAFDAGQRAHPFSIIAYPVAKFLQVYVVKRGFLDGPQGLIFCGLDALYSFLKRAKLWALAHEKQPK